MIVSDGDRRRPKRALHRIIRLVHTHSRRPPAPPDAARAQVSREPQGPTTTIGSVGFDAHGLAPHTPMSENVATDGLVCPRRSLASPTSSLAVYNQSERTLIQTYTGYREGGDAPEPYVPKWSVVALPVTVHSAGHSSGM